MFNNNNKIIDKFKTHNSLLTFSNNYLMLITYDIIDTIDLIFEDCKLESNENKFYKTFLPLLLSTAKNSPFIYVYIHLLKLNNEFTKSIEIYLTQNEIKIFDYLSKLLNEIKTMKNETKNVKNYIKNNFHILAKISIEKLILFVNEFFKDEHENVINKLDSIPKVQLKYIENVIETYKENLDEIYYNYSMKREFSKIC